MKWAARERCWLMISNRNLVEDDGFVSWLHIYGFSFKQKASWVRFSSICVFHYLHFRKIVSDKFVLIMENTTLETVITPGLSPSSFISGLSAPNKLLVVSVMVVLGCFAITALALRIGWVIKFSSHFTLVYNTYDLNKLQNFVADVTKYDQWYDWRTVNQHWN